jgi:Protein of unknown function (DUF3445)
VYFAAKTPHHMTADLAPLVRDPDSRLAGLLFDATALNWPVIEAKWRALQAGQGALASVSSDPAGLIAVCLRLLKRLSHEAPNHWQIQPEGLEHRLTQCGLSLAAPYPVSAPPSASQFSQSLLSELNALSPEHRLLSYLSLHLAEDFVILQGKPQQHQIEQAAVCFPSRWDPAEKIGLDFRAIHAPVADNQRLIKHADALMSALFTSVGGYVRYVWTLSRDHRLSQHPSLAPNVGDTICYRQERQTTWALPELGRLVFTIGIRVEPLSELSESQRETLLAAVNSMTEAVLDYKNLHSIKAQLNREMAHSNASNNLNLR